MYLIRHPRIRFANIILSIEFICLFTFDPFISAFVDLFECNCQTEMNDNNSALYSFRFFAGSGSLRQRIHHVFICIQRVRFMQCHFHSILLLLLLLFRSFGFGNGISFVNIVYYVYSQCVWISHSVIQSVPI